MMYSTLIKISPDSDEESAEITGRAGTVVEYGCEGSRGGTGGSGVFTRSQDGTWQQHTGTGQTPYFTSRRQFRRYLLERYDVRGRCMDESDDWAC